jgi:hypothetical protein
MIGVFNPRSARRVPQPHREFLSEPVFEPEARILRPASWRAPGGARNGGRFRALRAAFSFVAFFWPNKRKPPRVQGRSYPQLGFEIARGAREPFKTWIPAFAGMTKRSINSKTTCTPDSPSPRHIRNQGCPEISGISFCPAAGPACQPARGRNRHRGSGSETG